MVIVGPIPGPLDERPKTLDSISMYTPFILVNIAVAVTDHNMRQQLLSSVVCPVIIGDQGGLGDLAPLFDKPQ